MKKFLFGITLVLVLIGAGCNSTPSDSSMRLDTSATVETTVTTSGRELSFDISGNKYAYSQNTITVNQGDRVTINFISSLGMHDWNLDEFKAHTKIVNPGEKTSVTFVASKTGEYEYYCSVGNHRAMGMVGKLIVEPTDGPNAEDNPASSTNADTNTNASTNNDMIIKPGEVKSSGTVKVNVY